MRELLPARRIPPHRADVKNALGDGTFDRPPVHPLATTATYELIERYRLKLDPGSPARVYQQEPRDPRGHPTGHRQPMSRVVPPGGPATPPSVRRFTPVYAHRVTPDQIMKTYASPKDAFDHGDYLLAAEYAARGSELHGCALVMGGLIETGVEILRQQPHLSGAGLLSLGFGLWCLERSADAVETLRQIPATAPEQAAARGLIDW